MNVPAIPPPSKPPVWINRPEAFRRMVSDLARYPLIAVDTESNSLYVYREQVCLIQFSTGQTDYLVDPLALPDLSALGPFFASPDIEKVFHAAEYDIICMKRDFGFSFSNLFDTMVAARILGWENIGLGSVLEAEYGIELDKRYQRANWGQRPLPAAQLAYARLDSFYLIPLRHRMKTSLEESHRWPLAEEDFLRLCRTEVPVVENCNTWTRIPGGQDLTPRQAAVLEELCRYRDRMSQAANLPSFKVLSNKALLNIANQLPRTLADLEQVSDLSPRQIGRHGDGLLQAVRVGLQGQPLRRIAQPRPDERYLTRLDRLKLWRKNTGKEWGVESDIILPRDVMEELASTAPATREDLAAHLRDLPWRMEHFGDEILRQINHR